MAASSPSIAIPAFGERTLKQNVDVYLKEEMEYLKTYYSQWLHFRVMTEDERMCLMTGYIHQIMKREDLYQDIKQIILEFLYTSDYRSITQFYDEVENIAEYFKSIKNNAITQMMIFRQDTDSIQEPPLIVDNKHVFMLKWDINKATTTNYEHGEKIQIKKGPFVLVAPNKLEYIFPRDKVFCYSLVIPSSSICAHRIYFWTHLSKLGIYPSTTEEYDSSEHSSDHTSDE